MSAPRPSICLCMIVRDEVEVLAGCLASCREIIDTWVICDTGSTDGTQDLIGRELHGIPGELHEHEWVDFGHNRSRLMELAHGRADYLLVLDADTTLEGDPRQAPLTADSYMLRHADGASLYYTKRLVSGRIPWRYVGAVHEYIESSQERATGRLDHVSIRSRSVGAVRHGRWERDAALLEAELRRDPANKRATFYLAQTHRDLGGQREDAALLAKARDLYEQRAGMGGWEEEICCAWRQAGRLSARLGEWPRAVDSYINAWEARPERLESIQDLVDGLLERRQHRTAHRFTSLAVESALQTPQDILFVEPWIYEWGLLFQHSIATYWCGEFDASMRACKRLLRIPSLPEGHRDQTLANMRYAATERARQAVEQMPAPSTRAIHLAGTPTRGRPS